MHHYVAISWANWTARSDLYLTIRDQRAKDRGKHRGRASMMQAIKPDVAQLYKVPIPFGTEYAITNYRPDVPGTEHLGTLCWTPTARNQNLKDREAALKAAKEIKQ